MRLARFWPTVAGVFGVGLLYVVLAQADSKPRHIPVPSPVDTVFETAEAPFSPSDLPRLECFELATGAACTGKCDKAKGVTTCSPCTQSLTCQTGSTCQNASDCELSSTCKNTGCQAACSSIQTCSAAVAACNCGEKCDCTTSCKCGKACACATANVAADCTCGEKCGCVSACVCGNACACDGEKRVFKAKFKVKHAAAACDAAGCNLNACNGACTTACKKGSCEKEVCFSKAIACEGACGAGPACHNGQCPDHVFRAHPAAPPAMAMWTAPVPPPHQVIFATPPTVAHPPHAAPHHTAMHDQLVGAMIENARLQARDEAWAELQRRFEQTAELAIENARLKAEIKYAQKHRELTEKLAADAIENATRVAKLTAKLEAAAQREDLIEAFMEVATEKARLEAHVELFAAQQELHLEVVNAMIQGKEELFVPLHEALVENASLKASAEAQDEVAALKARIAELEKTLSKLNAGQKSGRTRPAAIKTARKPGADSEAK